MVEDTKKIWNDFIISHRIEPKCINAPSITLGSDFKILTYDDGHTEIVDRYPCRCKCS
jgi:hypothetical protein